MNFRLKALGGAAVILLFGAAGALAQVLETRGGYCNDAYFDSDGAGISGCFEFGLRYGEDIVGIGLYGASAEQKGHVKTDPLESLARVNAWYAREFEMGDFDYALSGHAGVQGGPADDLAISLRDALHDVFGEGSKSLTSTEDATFIAGISGWGRRDMMLNDSGAWATTLSPYVHAALGNDTIEAGGGLLLALQPSNVESLALLLPKTGAYAPTFGGDGIGVFADVRAVALESLYDDHANPFIAEAGVTAQATLWDFAVIGLSASCSTEPYDGAGKADCKATFQAGGLF
jgi:hypothetical protein